LIFNKCSGCFLRSIFSLLSSTFLEDKPQCLLPSLERIVVRNLDHDGDDISVAFVEMVKTRRSVLKSQSFMFEVVDCEITWSRSAQDGLRELAYDFSLTITEKSEEKIYGYFTDRELEIFTAGLDEADESVRKTVADHWRSCSWTSNNSLPMASYIPWPNLTSNTTAIDAQPSASTSSIATDGGGQVGTTPTSVSTGSGSASDPIFSQEFMQGVLAAVDSINPLSFRPDDDLNFERDFEQWFHGTK
jgi:hypothetical protein